MHGKELRIMTDMFLVLQAINTKNLCLLYHSHDDCTAVIS